MDYNFQFFIEVLPSNRKNFVFITLISIKSLSCILKWIIYTKFQKIASEQSSIKRVPKIGWKYFRSEYLWQVIMH